MKKLIPLVAFICMTAPSFAQDLPVDKTAASEQAATAAPMLAPLPVAAPAPAEITTPVVVQTPKKTTNSNAPVEISAAKTLEWNRADKTYTANGSAIAKQGDMKVSADKLTARYTNASGATDISVIEADGGVTLQSSPYTAYGDRAVYDTKTGVATMTGKNLRIETPTEKLTATDKIQFFDRDNRMTVTGSPVVTRNTDRLTANVMNAYFTEADGKRSIEKFTADGNVTIKTPKETVTGDKGTYNIATQKATITGHIRILQGESFIEGTRADIDLNTGIAKLFAEDNKETGGRVKGVFYPSPKKEK